MPKVNNALSIVHHPLCIFLGCHSAEKVIAGLYTATYFIATLSRQDASLDGCSVGDSLVGVDSLVGLLAVEVVLDQLLHLGDTCGSSHQHNLIDLLLHEQSNASV